jgi:hypothetical protein
MVTVDLNVGTPAYTNKRITSGHNLGVILGGKMRTTILVIVYR